MIKLDDGLTVKHGQVIKLSGLTLDEDADGFPIIVGGAGGGSAHLTAGTGDPNGVVSGAVGDLFLQTDSSPNHPIWVKRSNGFFSSNTIGDTFTGSNTTDIAGRTSAGYASSWVWSSHPSNGTNKIGIATNAAQGQQTANTVYLTDWAPGTSDYRGQFIVKFEAGGVAGDYASILLRYDPVLNSGYGFYVERDGWCGLFKVTNGSFDYSLPSIQTTGFGTTPFTVYATFSVVGSLLTGTAGLAGGGFDSYNVFLQTTDTTFAAGSFGMATGGSTGLRIDDIGAAALDADATYGWWPENGLTPYNNALAYEGVQIGRGAITSTPQFSDDGPVAIGWKARAIGVYSPVAIGESSLASGAQADAFGENTIAAGSASCSFGNFSEVYGDDSVACGPGILTYKYGATSVGGYHTNNAIQGIGVGQNHSITEDYSLVIGNHGVSIGANTAAICGFPSSGTDQSYHEFLFGANDITGSNQLMKALTFRGQRAAAWNSSTGRTNFAALDWTFIGQRGTGSGASAGFIFQTDNVGTTGTAIHTLSTRLTLNETGVIVGSGALATNATKGFLHVPSCAGVATGAPTLVSGVIPMVVDTTNSKVGFYVGGAWKWATLT